jgi:hypothetical protein
LQATFDLPKTFKKAIKFDLDEFETYVVPVDSLRRLVDAHFELPQRVWRRPACREGSIRRVDSLGNGQPQMGRGRQHRYDHWNLREARDVLVDTSYSVAYSVVCAMSVYIPERSGGDEEIGRFDQRCFDTCLHS